MKECTYADRLLKKYKKRLSEREQLWPDNIRRALAFIIARLFDPRLNVSWMKEQCYINDHNFSGRFTYYVELSPRQYITKHRRFLLQEPVLHQLSIMFVALSVVLTGISHVRKRLKEWKAFHTIGLSEKIQEIIQEILQENKYGID